MLFYNKNLKPFARDLRSNLTDAEMLLWFHIRRKRILGIQFCRQVRIGNFIVDFFAHRAKLVIELDGGQHFESEHLKKDQKRDTYLRQGL